MRTDKYMMAKAWMKQDQAPQAEALETWNTLEAEFNEERKAMLMASAESDKIKEEMNKKFGSGTVKYGSELPPIQNPFEDFEERNPAAEGGRIEFDKGLDVLPFKKLKNGKYSLRLYLGTENGKRIEKTFTGTKKELRKIYKNRGTRTGASAFENTIEYADSKGIPYEVKQGENKGKFAIRGPKEKEFSFYNTEELAQEHIDNYRAETDSVGGDRTGELENKKYKKGYKTKKQFLDFLAKNNIAGKNASSFAMNFNIKTEINPYNNNAYIYDTSQFTPEKIEEIQKAQVSSGTATEYAKNKFPPKPRSELIKIREDAIEAQGGIKKNSPFAGKKKLKVDLGHTGDYKTELITGDKLAYTPADVNFEIGKKGGIDDKIRAVKKRQEQALATLEGDELKKVLNETDATLTRLADQTKGFKSVVLSNGKKYGGERLTLDPFNIYPGKTEVEIKAIQKEYLGKDGKGKKIITEGPNKTSAAEIQKIQDAVIFEENRKSNLKAASKIGKKEINNLIKSIGCPNFKAAGGRIEFESGGDCFDKGQKIINSAQVKSPAAQKNLAKLINGLAKTGTFAKNALKFGVVPEALFVGAESIIRAGGDQTLDEGFKSAIGFYTDWTGKTNFKADARASQNLRNIGLDGTINIEMLNEMRDASEQVKKLENNQKNVLSVYDESLMGESKQDYKKRSDQQIEDAKKYLSTKYLTDSQKNFYTSQENEAIDIAGTRSPFKKFLGKAKADTEMMRYEDDFSGMQSDMFTQDPMSAKAKRDSVKNLPLRNQLSGSPGETAFMNLSQLPKGPRQGSQIDDLVNASNAQFKAQGVDTRVNSSVLKAIQDNKQNFKNMTMEEMIQAGMPMEAILGFNQPEVIKQKPMYDYAEGGITGLRSKYEYKK